MIPQIAVKNVSAKGEKFLTVRITDAEMEKMKQYCSQENRTQTDVIRAYLRSLKRKLSNRGTSSPLYYRDPSQHRPSGRCGDAGVLANCFQDAVN